MEILLVILFVIIVFTVIQLMRISISGPESKESEPDNISFQEQEKKNSEHLEEVDY